MFELSKFSDRLSDLLFDEKENNNIDLNVFAGKLGIHLTTVYKYLEQKHVPSVAILVKFADYFHCTVDYLIGKENLSPVTSFRTCPPFCEQFRFLLKYYGISKYRIALTTGIASSALYAWQNNEKQPSIDSVVKLSECFECSVDFVLGREK